MADPISMVAIGSNVAGGVIGAAGAGVQAKAQQTAIQGSMLSTIAKAFGMQVEATQYDYQANVAQYKAAVAKLNADIAEQNASYERDVGEITAEQSGMKTRADVSAMKAHQGASGIDVNRSDSSVHVRESMIELGAYDQMMLRSNAARKAFGYEVEKTQDLAQADLYRYESGMNLAQKQNALTAAGLTMEALPLQQQAYSLAGQAGSLGAMASLVNMGGSVASKWLDPKFGFTSA